MTRQVAGALLGLLAAVLAASADTVRTKDGQSFTGRPISQTNDCIRLRTKYGDLAVPRADVAKHERSTYVVELKDGTNVEGQIQGETETELTVQVDKDTRTIPLAQVKDVAVKKPPPPEPPKPDLQKRAEWHRQALELLQKKDYAKAIEKYGEILKAEPEDTLAFYNLACAYALSGDKTRALELLRKSVEGGFVSFGHITHDPDLDSLREEAAYKDLLARKDEYVRQASERAVKQITEYLARQKIDAKAYKTFYDEERRFVYLHAKSEDEFALVRKGMEDFAACLWRDLFEHRPEQPLYIVLLTAQDSPKVLKNGIGGIFMNAANTLFCGDMPAYKLLRASIVTHEFTHGLHWADQMARQQQHPIWLVEGLSTLFETSRREDGKLTPLHSYRLSVVQQAVKIDRSIPWDTFAKLNPIHFMANANLCYAQARYMFLYLHEKGLLKAFYDEYTKASSYEGDKSALEAFEVVFGKPAAAVERDWKEWVLKQQVPAIAFLGVQTEEKDQRLIVKSVVDSSAASAAGIRKGDVIVTLEGTPIRTQSDLMEVIGNRNVGEEIDIGLERDGKPVALTATLKERPGTSERTTEKAPYLGLSVGEAAGQVQVREVEKDSPAARAGIEPGWRILKFGQTEIKSVRDFLGAVKKSKPGQAVELRVQKAGQDPTTLKLEVAGVPSAKE
jgi:hypothetical protein